MSRLERTLALMLSVVSLSALSAAAASADAIASATYTGVAADGARVSLTISPDGTLVSAYHITNISQPCQFAAGGDTGVWGGTPIIAASFSYDFQGAIIFRGHFSAPRSLSGTFRVYTPANHCDTGVVSWTATTSASGPAGGAGQGKRHRFVTRVDLREHSMMQFVGRVRSGRRACRANRTVILWRGAHRIAKTRTKTDGTFTFWYSAAAGGLGLRASVTPQVVRPGLCSAGSSTFIQVT